MADQKRWFKVWTSLLVDMDNRPAEDVGHWVRLGCRIALVGTRGAVAFDDWDHVGRFFRVPAGEAMEILCRLPSVYLSDAPISWPHGHDKSAVCEGMFFRGDELTEQRGEQVANMWGTRNGQVIVTMKNWSRYQVDTTGRERGRRHGLRRGESNGTKQIGEPPLVSSKASDLDLDLDLESESKESKTKSLVRLAKRRRRTKTTAPEDPAFQAFYQAYPRRQGRARAWQAWQTLAPENGLGDRILAAVAEHAAMWQREHREPQHIPLPATWLNGKRWEDETTSATPADDPYAGYPRF